MEDPSLTEWAVEHSSAGTVKMPASLRFDGQPPRVRPSPMLGEDVNNVLASWLGMDARSIAALREEGIV